MHRERCRTLSKAIGRDNFSMGAVTEELVDAVFDGIETVEAAELMEENDDAATGRSEYKTSWLFMDGWETATAVIVDGDGSITSELSRVLSGGTLLLGGGSMA